MENVIIGTRDNVSSLIAQGKTTILDFWAPGCGPCVPLGKTLDEIAKENSNLLIIKVNSHEYMDLAISFGVRTVPRVFIFKNGMQITEFSGGKMSKYEILKLLPHE